MKKLSFAMLLSLMLIFTACGDSDKKDVDDSSKKEETQKEDKEKEKKSSSTGGKWSVDEDGAINVDEYEFNDRDQVRVEGEKYSDDSELFTATTKLGNVEVNVPFELSKITAEGFEIEKDDPEMEVADRYGIPSVRLKTDEDYSLVVSVYNVSGATVPLKDTMVERLSFSRRNNDDLEIAEHIEFPLGINFASSMEDIVAAYGEPTSAIITGLDGLSVAFSYDSEDGYDIGFSFYKGMLKSATIGD